jgi:hypothetical protein
MINDKEFGTFIRLVAKVFDFFLRNFCLFASNLVLRTPITRSDLFHGDGYIPHCDDTPNN